jgi:hypothetical protein
MATPSSDMTPMYAAGAQTANKAMKRIAFTIAVQLRKVEVSVASPVSEI